MFAARTGQCARNGHTYWHIEKIGSHAAARMKGQSQFKWDNARSLLAMSPRAQNPFHSSMLPPSPRPDAHGARLLKTFPTGASEENHRAWRRYLQADFLCGDKQLRVAGASRRQVFRNSGSLASDKLQVCQHWRGSCDNYGSGSSRIWFLSCTSLFLRWPAQVLNHTVSGQGYRTSTTSSRRKLSSFQCGVFTVTGWSTREQHPGKLWSTSSALQVTGIIGHIPTLWWATSTRYIACLSLTLTCRLTLITKSLCLPIACPYFFTFFVHF